MHRVVITGVGVVTPVGIGTQEFWKALKNGKNGITRITKFDPSPFKSQIAGEVKGFEPSKNLDFKEIKRYDLFTLFALYTTIEAIEDSGLDIESLDMDRVGVIYASGIGGENTWEVEHTKLLEKGPGKVSPLS